MALSTANPLYPVNSTVLYTTGRDVRLLSSAEAGATSTQTCTATHTQDNVNRTWDPATAGVTVAQNPGLFAPNGFGWALRLSEDMTPTDDTNCNATLSPGTISVSMNVAVSQSGGTYLSGTVTPLLAAAIFRYNPSTNAATLITFGNSNATSWTVAGLGADMGTFKTVTFTMPLAAAVEFQPGEILYLQMGFNTGALPNPTVGTGTFTFTLNVDHPDTNLTFAAGQGIHQVCAFEGAATGSGDATGSAAKLLGTSGSAAGSSTLDGVLGATAGQTGSAVGTAAVAGALSATAEQTGSAAGAAAVAGSLGAQADLTGAAAGSGSVDGSLGAFAFFLGAASGSSIVSGALSGRADMTGASAGTSTADGLTSSLSGTVGNAAGSASVSGAFSSVLGTVGTVEIGEGGGSTTIIRPIFVLDD